MTVNVGRVIAGKYRLERPLAKGGMGSIWIARHLLLDVAVAVKFMDPAFAAYPEIRARFEQEAKACAQLKSPHIVQVHDYGIDADTAYLVMELLEGEDLATRLKRIGRLSLPAAVAILGQACKGLRRAHEAGIVHRDLKPGNIFLVRHDDEEIVKVLDFGIAKATGPAGSGTATSTGALIGSPYYMSPEQIRRAREVDQRSDLWSLGVILYECLTGDVPFRSPEIGDVLVAICTDPIDPPSKRAPFLSAEVDRFFERALARDPAQRFQSAREMAEAFAALLGMRASGADWSGVRASHPPPPQVPTLQGQPPPARGPAERITANPTGGYASTEVITANPVGAHRGTEVITANPVGGVTAPWAPPGSAASGDGTFAPAGRNIPPPGKRGAPAAAVLVAILGTLALLGLGGMFLVRWAISGSSAAPVPISAAPGPADEKTPPQIDAIPTPTSEAETPPAPPSATAPAVSSPAFQPTPPGAGSAPGKRPQPPPAKTSPIFGF